MRTYEANAIDLISASFFVINNNNNNYIIIIIIITNIIDISNVINIINIIDIMNFNNVINNIIIIILFSISIHQMTWTSVFVDLLIQSFSEAPGTSEVFS